MFVQKDIYVGILNEYKASSKAAKNIKHDKNHKIKPMEWTTNLIENIRVTETKTLPIQNSHLKKVPVIRPYAKCNGSLALPTLKKDLKMWKIC